MATGPKYLTKWDGEDLPEPATLFENYEKRLKAHRDQEMQIDRDLTRYDLKLDPPRGLTPEQLKVWNTAYGPKNEAFETATLSGKDLVRWKYQRYIKDYLRCIQSVDDAVGKLLDYLDESGLAKNTIVIYCSDQGFHLGGHGWFDKRWIYEESLRTPFLVRWPGVVKAGTEGSDIVSPLDLAETFCEIAGIQLPSDMQGRSLLPVLKGKTPKDWRKSFYYHYYEYPGWHLVRRHYGVADGRYKLVHFYEKSVAEWELIDLKADPLEQKNFYGVQKYAKIQTRLQRNSPDCGDNSKCRSKIPPLRLRLATLRSDNVSESNVYQNPRSRSPVRHVVARGLRDFSGQRLIPARFYLGMSA